jgi:hypothetical protein
VRGAIELIRDAEALAAGNRDPLAALHAPGGCSNLTTHCGASQHDEVHRIASVERQRDDALVVDHFADAGGARFDERRRGFDRDGLGHLSDRQRHVEHRVRVDLQRDARLYEAAEAAQRHLEAIRTERKVRQRVRARRVGGHAAREAGVGLRGGDGGARQDAAAVVTNGAVDLRGRALGDRERREHEDAERCVDDRSPQRIHRAS